ncbi:MAG: hydrogenase iron-sulfur subunit, partial [Acidimicrobiia bacterium]|nr:hydrogenase iron-sulfur subunit [Acidimicrobiia bacterium]
QRNRRGLQAFTCKRHEAHCATETVEAAVIPLPCVGMVHPSLIGSALDSGAAAVHIVGCPPGDCAYREGPVTMAARLNRERRPRLKRRYRAAPISTDWISPTRLSEAIAAPGRVPDATLAPPVGDSTWRPALPLLALIAVTAVLTILVTGFRFDPGGNNGAVLEVSLDHRAGVPLLGFMPFAAAPSGAEPRLSIESDGTVLFDDSLAVARADEAGTALFFDRFPLAPGTHRIRITLADAPGTSLVLFEDTVSIARGEALVLNYRDVSLVDPAAAGRSLFNTTALGTSAGCRICHSLDPGRDRVGPSLAGVGTRAAATVGGLSAEEYLRQSLVNPDAYVVPGYPSGQMLANLGDVLSPAELDSLVAFLLTLEETG